MAFAASNTDEAKETIPARLVANVKAQIYNYLFIPALPNGLCLHHATPRSRPELTLFSVGGEAETREYPRLCWLAQVDMTKFLGVMGIALEDPDRATTSPLNHQTMFHILQDLILARHAGSTQADQFSVNLLCFVCVCRVVRAVLSRAWLGQAVDVNLFLNFTGKYVAKRAINVSEEMLKRVLTHLTRGGAREDGPEREQLMLNLVLAHPSLLDQSLLIQLENATPYPLYVESFTFPHVPCAAVASGRTASLTRIDADVSVMPCRRCGTERPTTTRISSSATSTTPFARYSHFLPFCLFIEMICVCARGACVGAVSKSATFDAISVNVLFAQQLVFGTIQDLLKETMGNEKARETLTRETLGVVRELIGVNPKETAALIQSFVAPGTLTPRPFLRRTRSRHHPPRPHHRRRRTDHPNPPAGYPAAQALPATALPIPPHAAGSAQADERRKVLHPCFCWLPLA
jgi:hypothetical protein